MKKKLIIACIAGLIVIGGIGGGISWSNHTKKEIVIKHQQELEQATKIKQDNTNFNSDVKKAFAAMDKDNSTTEYKQIIDSIDTKNLSKENITKLNNLKSTLPEMTKVCEAEQLLESNKFSKAQDVFKTINQTKLVKDGIMTSTVFNNMQTQINNGIKKNEYPTAGFIRNIVGKIYGLPVLVVTKDQWASFQHLENTDPKYCEHMPKGFINKALARFGDVTITTPNDASAGKPNLEINGKGAYSIFIQQTDVGLEDGNEFSVAVIGTDGTVYNQKQLCDAIESGNLDFYGYQNEYSGKQSWGKMTVQDASGNYRESTTVMSSSGSCAGLIESKDNPTPKNWSVPSNISGCAPVATSSESTDTNTNSTKTNTNNSNNVLAPYANKGSLSNPNPKLTTKISNQLAKINTSNWTGNYGASIVTIPVGGTFTNSMLKVQCASGISAIEYYGNVNTQKSGCYTILVHLTNDAGAQTVLQCEIWVVTPQMEKSGMASPINNK